MVYSTDRSMVPVLVILFVALWFFYKATCFKSCLVLFCSCVFSPFCIAITSLANLSAFLCLFDFRLFVFVISSSSWCLRRTAACDCGIPWTFLLPFLNDISKLSKRLLGNDET